MEGLHAHASLEMRLLENHLEFLRSHRGSVAPVEGGVAIRSEKAEFTYLIAASAAAAGSLKQHRCVHRLPWSGIDAATLEKAGFARKYALAYMTDPEMLGAETPTEDLAVDPVTSAVAMEEFTEVQAQAFLETPKEYAAWQPFLRAANFANLANGAQTFYVVRNRGRAVSVTLAVRTAATVGLYAVATKPEHRKRGFAKAAMSRAVVDARAHHGCDLIGLQVIADSAADRYYRGLGFRHAFVADVFSR